MSLVMNRRHVLAALGAAAAALPVSRLFAQQAAAPHRIDVHHHFTPPGYFQESAADRARRGLSGTPPAVQNWSPQRSVEEMDKNGIATSMMSIATGGIWFGDRAQTQRLARQTNEFGTKMIGDHKGRFGLFAVLPLPNVDDSLKEIEYALDTLKADGFGLLTSYDTTWAGDPKFAPVFEEPNRRKAVVYFHLSAPECCQNLIPYVPQPTVEYPHDTTRAILSFLFNGGFRKYRDIKFIWSHAGGSMPILAGRISNSARNIPNARENIPDGAIAEFQRLYYDTANSGSKPTMAALMALVPTTQILFGTDYPWVPAAATVNPLNANGFPPEVMRAIDRENALALLPRLRAA
jgi:predicted TIM-barrel fold metal-dependent hydrolase